MVNKKGWLRIVEASISILIIFGVLLVVNTKTQVGQQTDLTSMTTPILEEIARNVTFRDHIISEGNGSVEEVRAFVATRLIQSNIKYDVAVCDVGEICSLPAYPSDAAEIYAGERIISASLNQYAPKKVKIFLWRPVA